MPLYLDTSCMVKLFIDEADSEAVRRAVQDASILATSLLSFVEMHSAISRRQREKSLTAAEAQRVRDAFELDWAHYLRIGLHEAVIRSAVSLVRRHALRSYDAVHLASALELRGHDPQAVFMTADSALRKAAVREHLRVEP